MRFRCDWKRGSVGRSCLGTIVMCVTGRPRHTAKLEQLQTEPLELVEHAVERRGIHQASAQQRVRPPSLCCEHGEGLEHERAERAAYVDLDLLGVLRLGC